MTMNLRWKILLIIGIVALAGWSVYPPGEKVRLGLDLKGGVHMVLRVQTDDALRIETETAWSECARSWKCEASELVR